MCKVSCGYPVTIPHTRKPWSSYSSCPVLCSSLTMTHSTKSTHTPVYVVLTIIVSVILFQWSCYLSTTSLKDLCSPALPHTSVILDLPTTLPDGSLQVADGTVYPPWAKWKQDGIVRGCQCSIKPCVMRCCPEGQYVEYGRFGGKGHCSYSKSNPVEMIRVMSETTPRQILNVSKNHFSFIEARCSEMFHLPIWLQNDGLAYEVARNVTNYGYFTWCYDFGEPYSPLLPSFICSKFPQIFDSYLSTCDLIKKYVDYFILSVHLITLIVFSMLPELRTGYGESIMCYVATLFVRHVVIFWEILSFPSTVPFKYYTDLSIHLWQILIPFQVWTTFRSTKAPVLKANPKRIIIHSTIGWGLPFLIQFILSKTIGMDGIKFQIFTYIQIYYYYHELVDLIPVMILQILELVNIVLGFNTLIVMRRKQLEANKLQDTDSKAFNGREIQWSSVFIKVTLVISVDYVLLNILGTLGFIAIFEMAKDFKYHYRLCSAIISCLAYFKHLRGLEIFIVFVCKRYVFGLIQKDLNKKTQYLFNCWMNVKGQLYGRK